MINVWLTREEDENNIITAKLAEKNIGSISKPILNRTINNSILEHAILASYGKNIIITSKFAAKILISYFPKGLNCYVVGNKTAHLLKENGFITKLITRNAKELIDTIKEINLENFVYLRGNLITHQMPLGVNEYIIYQSKYLKTLDKNDIELLSAKNLKFIFIFSLASAKAVTFILKKYNISLDNFTFVTLSKKIANFIKEKSIRVHYSENCQIEEMIDITAKLILKL